MWSICLVNAFPGKREILDLAVKCDYVNRGCLWEGTVYTLREHTSVCAFTPVPCPNACWDTNNKITQVSKKDVSDHLQNHCFNRPHKCQHCGETGSYAEIARHVETCPERPLQYTTSPCPVTVGHRHLKRHLEDECDFTVVPCKYQRIGCDVKLWRKDKAAHERDDSLHLHHAIDAVIDLEKKLQDTMTSLKSKDTFTFKLTWYRRLKNSKKWFQSPPFLF